MLTRADVLWRFKIMKQGLVTGFLFHSIDLPRVFRAELDKPNWNITPKCDSG